MVIVGAGLAGASAAEELRNQGFEGAVVLLGRENQVPYIRPPLSKGYLAGEEGWDAAQVHPAAWYAERRIQLITGATAVAIDRGAREVVLADDRRLRYDRLLLATGSTPRTIDLPGAQLGGVHTLRTIEDSDVLRAKLSDGDKRVVLIGSGWIGMEVAATARTLGNEVTVIDRGQVPLSGPLGERLARVFLEVHEENEVGFRHEAEVAAIEGTGSVSGVRLASGELIAADVVVVAIGAAPEVGLARAAGLEVDDGVLADERLATSDPDIFVAGDIANHLHPVIRQRIRSEHWANAGEGGKAAARAMLDPGAVYDAIPYFYTDQFDLGMEYSGYPSLVDGAELLIRGDLEDREFVAFWLQGDRVVAGMNVNVWDVNEQVQRLIRDEVAVDRARLADDAVPLEDL